jgi:hypothetical protein
MISIVGNNAEHFSALWATTRKNVQRCKQQRGRIAKMQNSKHFFVNLALPLKRQLTYITPNCTGRGQSWPCQLWHQIPDKILIYPIFKKITYSFRNVFRIFLNFWYDLKKWWFDVYVDVFFVRSPVSAWPCLPPLPLDFTANTDHPSRGEARLAMVRSPVQHQSTFQPVSEPGCVECGGRQILSRARSLSLSN